MLIGFRKLLMMDPYFGEISRIFRVSLAQSINIMKIKLLAFLNS